MTTKTTAFLAISLILVSIPVLVSFFAVTFTASDDNIQSNLNNKNHGDSGSRSHIGNDKNDNNNNIDSFSQRDSTNEFFMSKRPEFPSHWGSPPLIQTRDLVPLPSPYGRGSGTLKKWIETKMAQDRAAATANANANDADDDDPPSWPEQNLVGYTGDEAKRIILRSERHHLSEENVHILPQDAMVTMDYREDRVRIFVDDDGKVVRQPRLG